MNNSKPDKIESFTDLVAWRESHKLVIMIYHAAKIWPKEEIFGLTSQIKRCVVSVSSNIAEGFSRNSYKDKCNFYYMALSSLTELQNQILISKDLDYTSGVEFKKLADQSIIVSKLINGLIKKTKEYIK